MKRRKLSVGRILLLVMFIVIIVIGVFLFIKDKDDSGKDNNEPLVEEIPVVDNIDNFGYVLMENETSYFKNLFNELKEVLNQEEINYDKYSELVLKLFIADALNLDNKISNADIGGVQFVYEPFRDDYVNIAKTTLYNYIESNVYSDRTQELPIVDEVIINDVIKSEFKYNDKIFEGAYHYDITVVYKKNLGYETDYKVVIIRNDKKLEIAKMQVNS